MDSTNSDTSNSGEETTTGSDITTKTDNIIDNTRNQPVTDPVTLYTSIGLGVLAIILLGLIIGIVVKKRKEEGLAVERNCVYGLADYFEDTQVVECRYKCLL